MCRLVLCTEDKCKTYIYAQRKRQRAEKTKEERNFFGVQPINKLAMNNCQVHVNTHINTFMLLGMSGEW